MIKELSIISFSVLLSFVSICQAQEETVSGQEEPLSSEMKLKQTMIETKGKVLSDINKQAYNKSKDAFMREYVRNSNAMKKIMDKPTKDVNIKDKKALSQYMQDEIGLQKEIIQVNIPEEKNKSARPTAADLLK